MKILFISMPSIHVIRWIENLRDTEHELYWFDVTNRGQLNTLESVQQFTNWPKRKLPYVKGEYFLSKKAPILYEMIRPFLEVTANEELERIIKQINPDVIHSFEMQSCSYPIVKTMQKFPTIKWIYSCWGSDLFYYKNLKEHSLKINQVLHRINYLHTDCNRDFSLAKELGFKGIHVCVIPGGGGYDLKLLEKFKLPITNRNIILVKGYEHTFGRGLNVVKALEMIKNELGNYKVVVFGAHQSVINYILERNLPFKFYHRHELSHIDLIKLMGKSLIYIGNSISDGMPNTLLEAISMGAFPVQSNPGGATAEIITEGVNGFLINDPEDIEGIAKLILNGINNQELLSKAAEWNLKLTSEKLEYNLVKNRLIELYDKKLKF